jgi:hypothetical protein
MRVKCNRYYCLSVGPRLQQDVHCTISSAVGYALRRCADFMAHISAVRETKNVEFLYAGTCVRWGQGNIKFLYKVVTGHKMQTGGYSGDET